MDFSYGYDSGISTDTRYSDTSANVSIDYGATSTFSGAFSLRDAPISIETNTPYQVVMYGTIDGEATMDASLFLDPQFTAPTGYDLYFSSGVENGGGVPEPSAWAMMILGMAGLGGVIRRRRVAPAHRSVA